MLPSSTNLNLQEDHICIAVMYVSLHKCKGCKAVHLEGLATLASVGSAIGAYLGMGLPQFLHSHVGGCIKLM